MKDNPNTIESAIMQLSRLPGIGERSATRLAYWLMRAKPGTISAIVAALTKLEHSVKECTTCCNLTETDPCTLCSAIKRDNSTIIVVERPQDVLAFERAGDYGGLYHVLHGTIAPLNGVGPDDLRIRQLLNRLNNEEVTEIVIATNPTVEGDTTALYLGKLLSTLGLKVTRLAHGLSVGTEIEYANAVSLSRAYANRREE